MEYHVCYYPPNTEPGGGGVMSHKLKELYAEADGRNRNYSTPSVARHCAKDFTDFSEAVNGMKGKWESVQSKRLPDGQI